MDQQKYEVIVLPDLQAISQAAAERLSQIALDAVSKRGVFHLVLSGGRTPETLYRLLSIPPFSSSLPWPQTQVYWGDERSVSLNSAESNSGQAWRTFLKDVPVPEDNIHRISGELEPRLAAEEYCDLLKSFSGQEGEWPRFDLIFLGLGDDGHTASLFPGPIRQEEKNSLVMAVTADYGDRPPSRITMTPLAINSARNIIFLVSGSRKAAALDAALNGPTDLEKWPVQRIRPENGRTVWLVDQDAGQDAGQDAWANL
ncbi:MAG: 6-phosphogluconolactonase [Anaerolineae bacterium]|nr:MAG: 6-phosphogluconolactonase [Anaerolineae bacterium]